MLLTKQVQKQLNIIVNMAIKQLKTSYLVQTINKMTDRKSEIESQIKKGGNSLDTQIKLLEEHRKIIEKQIIYKRWLCQGKYIQYQTL